MYDSNVSVGVWYQIYWREQGILLGIALIRLLMHFSSIIHTSQLYLFFHRMVFGQVSPVCAIVGGVLAQEIIKAVSHKDPPHKNFFFFTTLDGAGVVECIGH